jgi:hypothetical protein
MNERIKELAEQANANELSYAYYRGEKRPENAVTLHSVDLEKFAELIVQECLQLCINVHNDADRPFSVPGSLHCMEEIREHFGVEE